MDQFTVMLLAMAALGLTALVTFVGYRWRQRRRVVRVKRWVSDYLLRRYGEIPGSLSIDCSDDVLWPVLVAFDAPRTGVRHRLQFQCGGAPSTFALHSERQEGR